ncbi:MAG: ATP synthase F1 subunit gamma [Oscillospiraceae bacterium]|nr:ATP synthase F1 subunit gamma [Oscillospiraceae bacterium]
MNSPALIHRINSVKQTVQISNAQKLIATSQIGKARRLFAQSKPYHDRIAGAVAEVLRRCPEVTSRYVEHRSEASERRGLLVLSANRGLAGGFDNNIIHLAEKTLEERPAAYVIVLGHHCRSHLANKGHPVDMEYDQPLEPPAMFTARELAEKMSAMLLQGKIDLFDIIYTNYVSAVRMEPVVERLLPLSRDIFNAPGENRDNFSFEPSPEVVLESMILKYLKGYLYGCLTDTWICELTSRVTAMDSAVRNGNDMLASLSLIYNRTRQAAITQEITEIVAGAAALGGDD